MKLRGLAKHQSRVERFGKAHRTGLVSVVFTDMVGFTHLKQRLGDIRAYEIIREHHTLVREILERFEGAEEIACQGDSFFLVFGRPSDAAKFCLITQARLREFSEDKPGRIEDRMGVHVGEALIEEDAGGVKSKDYYGLEIDTSARLMSLAQGNQILMTRAAFDSAKNVLKGQEIEGIGELSWVSHGQYLFKGVDEPLEVCEVGESTEAVLSPPPNSEKAWRYEPGEEKPPDEWRHQAARVRWKAAATGAAVTTLLGLYFLVSPMDLGVKTASYDWPFTIRGPVPIKEAEIAYLDEETYLWLEKENRNRGLPKQSRSEALDRGLHAEFLSTPAVRRAKAVVFDILFDEAWADKEVDQAFARAIREHGRVVLAAKLLIDQSEGRPVTTRPILPVEPLDEAAPWGVVELPLDSDRAVRRHFYRPGYTNLSGQVARLAGKQLTVPTSRRWMNYYGPRGQIPHISYSRILDREAVPTNYFADKILFVGKGATITPEGIRSDEFRTPHTRWTGHLSPGVEIQATAALNLIRGDWLEETSRILESLIVLGCGLLFGAGLSLMRPWIAACGGLAGSALTTLSAYFMFRNYGVWFPWLIPALVQVPCAFAWSVFSRGVILNRQKTVLEEALAKAKAAAGRSGQGIEISTVKTPSQLARSSSERDRATQLDSRPKSAGVPHVPNYSLIRRIGKGGYGEVWIARNLVGIYQAVKVVYRNSFTRDAPYLREFNGLQRFSPISTAHPGFVAISYVGRDDEAGYFYYVMELGDDTLMGREVDPQRYSPKTLATEFETRGRYSVAECIQLGLDLTDALSFLHHEHLTHRDIKPSNILFVKKSPKLADIGLVTDLGRTGTDASYVGTEGYIAPEGPGRATADIYSLGKVLYEAAMGRDHDSFPDLPSSLAERPDLKHLVRLNDIIVKACDHDANQRYQAAEELHEALKTLRDGRQIPTGP